MSIDNKTREKDESIVETGSCCINPDNNGNYTYIFYITANGKNLAERIKLCYPDAVSKKFDKDEVHNCWHRANRIVFIMASGIVVRTIASLLSDKRTDPAVVVIDEKGKHVISLCGGHLGGANEFASVLSEQLNATPIITTSSDVNKLPAIDLWARDNNLEIENAGMIAKLGVKFADEKRLSIFVDDFDAGEGKDVYNAGICNISMPDEFVITSDPEEADIIVIPWCGVFSTGRQQLILRPKVVIAGIGCNKGTSQEEIEDAVLQAFDKSGLSPLSLLAIATIDIKSTEPGLVAYSKRHNIQVITATPNDLNDEISKSSDIEKSDTVYKATGAYAVAEPAAILIAKRLLKNRIEKQEREQVTLIMRKQKIGNVTVALAKVPSMYIKKQSGTPDSVKTTLFVVGTGPGSIDHITPYAQRVIAECDVIAGYHTYLRLIPELIENKELVATGMTKELDRCEKAVDQALKGKTVCVISGGDPGIYAMAGLVFEVLKARDAENSIDVEIVPGISALNACAARLGAPLMHDFAAISLSDRLTPWDLIEKRLEAAASADFVIALYNPRSKGRQGHIEKARDIIMKHREADTPVGLVKAAMRPDENIVHTNLAEMLDHEIDMQTTVIIGNTSTFTWNEKMVTPRGYKVR
jgi:cobalt-precorrin 5A hydrolase/precorrin-3B C17-methyltransferase